jgi:hypothetical protein
MRTTICFIISIGLSLFLLIITITPLSAKNMERCPNLQQNIKISINIIQKDVDYDLTVTQKKLTQLANKLSASRSAQNEKVLGLTETGHFLSYAMKSQIAQIGKSRYCARIISINMEIRVTKLTVYVLGKYPKGSCHHNAIIDHEHEHVATFQTGIEIIEQKFRQNLLTILHSIKPGIGVSPKQANQTVFKSLKNKIEKIRRPIEKKIKLLNRKIDTPLSYKLLSQQCQHW